VSNSTSNAPMMPAGSSSFFEIWVNALTKPREETFSAMASSPKARATTAYLWVFFGTVVQFVLSALVQSGKLRTMLEQWGYGGNLPAGGLGFTLISAICLGPILAVFVVVMFAIVTALIQWVARMFGGRGTFDQLAYTFGAIQAPFAILAGLVMLLGAIPFVGICFRLALGLAGIYVFVLQIIATKAVNQFGAGQAFASVVIPGLAISFVCCCAAAAGLTLVGASIGNIWSTINYSLQGLQ